MRVAWWHSRDPIRVGHSGSMISLFALPMPPILAVQRKASPLRFPATFAGVCPSELGAVCSHSSTIAVGRDQAGFGAVALEEHAVEMEPRLVVADHLAEGATGQES